MLVVRWRLPITAPGGEQEAGAGGVERVDRGQQSRHAARPEDQAVKPAIGVLPLPHLSGDISGMCRLFGCLQNG